MGVPGILRTKRPKPSKRGVKRWRVHTEVTTTVVVEALSATEAERLARYVGDAAEKQKRVTVHWIDAHDVPHFKQCLGNHCRHYGCTEHDANQYEYCSQCGPTND